MLNPMKSLFHMAAISCLWATGVGAQPVAALPDASRTPGSVDTAVTQSNIQSTVCVRGYTDTVRPDKKYTNRLKREQLRKYHYTDTDPRHYEMDHLIPLNIGGNPTDPNNLWPQPRDGEWSAEQKNELEWIVYKMVCRGEIGLGEAQQRVARNWIEAYQAWVPSRRHWLPSKKRRDD
ncbi:MAG: HNH endonuclease [Betaproteobacteria bacterium]|jgi:hypothetical protein|nr:HNH endonuclease [Betaproteobacteria bacterium]